jgi:hypothetical protein
MAKRPHTARFLRTCQKRCHAAYVPRRPKPKPQRKSPSAGCNRTGAFYKGKVEFGAPGAYRTIVSVGSRFDYTPRSRLTLLRRHHLCSGRRDLHAGRPIWSGVANGGQWRPRMASR